MMAQAVTPRPDVNLAPNFLIPCGILAICSLGLCSARIYTRCKPVLHLKVDDYLIVLAEIFSLFEYITVAISAANGWGRLSYYVPAAKLVTALKAGFAVEILWMQAIALVRLSIACSLLPLSRNKIWRSTFYSLITGQIILYVAWMVVTFAGCRPLASFWDHNIVPVCLPQKVVLNCTWATAAFYILMDLTMAIAPIILIRTLNRSRSEKILVAGLMAMGLLTTAAAGAKMSSFPHLLKGDVLQGMFIPSLLAKLEEQVGIICACLPTLKSPAERFLIRIGVLSSDFRHNFSRPSFVMSTRHALPLAAPSGTLQHENDHSEYNGSTDTIWHDESHLTSTKPVTTFRANYLSPSEQTLAQASSKGSFVRVDEV